MTVRLFWEFCRLLFKERMEYRGAFLLGAFAQIVSYAGSYIVTWFVVNRFGSIAGWNWPEIAMLISIGLFTYALGAALTWVQMRDLEGMVHAGTFDGVLLKPLNPYWYVLVRQFNFAYIAHITISGLFLLWSASQLEVSWTAGKIVYLAMSIISGAMLQAGMLSAIGGTSFVLVRNGFMFNLFFRLKDFISYPLSIYNAAIQLLLIVIIPFAFINFIPCAWLLGKDLGWIPPWLAFLAPLVGPLWFWFGYRVWMNGANRYQGAGG